MFALRALAVPAAPGNLLATPANARVTVTWSGVTGATSYNVYRSLTPGGPYGSPLATGLTVATYTDNAAANDTTYYYVATAVDGTGEGPRSAEDPATPRSGTFVSGVIGSANSPITTTWTPAGSPYVVAGNVEVRGTRNSGDDRTSTLIIQSGVIVLFEPGTGLFIGDDTGIDGGHSGRLQASGVTFTSNRIDPQPGDWRGIRFGSTAVDGGTNTFLNGCTVEWAGGAGAVAALEVSLSQPELRNGTAVRQTASGGVHVSASAAVTISNGEIEGATAPAVQVLGSSSLALTGTRLRSGPYPVRIQPNVVLAALSGNTAEGYAFEQAGVAVEGGVMGNVNSTQSRTWPGGDLPYIVLADVAVRGTRDSGDDRTSTLILGPSAEVRFAAGTGLSVGDDTNNDGGHWGRLLATNVTFTANSSSPGAGFWKGIYFANTSVAGASNTLLDHCVVDWAGGGGRAGAVVANLSGPVLRNGTVVRNTATTGVWVSDGSTASISDGEVEGGSGPAVRVLGFSSLILERMRLRGGTYPVHIQPNVVLAALSGNTAEGYNFERSGIAVEGGVMGNGGSTQSRTWPGGDLPYIVLGDLAVRGMRDSGDDRTSTLILGPSVEMRFAAGTALLVGDDSPHTGGHWGRLQATSVTFRANVEPAPAGSWKGIAFGRTARGDGHSFLDGSEVESAGGPGSTAAVTVDEIALILRNGTAVRSVGTAGLHLSADPTTSVTVTGGEIEGGSGPAVHALGNATLSLTGVALRGGTYPVRIEPNVVLAALSGNTAEGYAFEQAGIAVEGGVMGNVNSIQSRTWRGGDLPYIVLADIAVRGTRDSGDDRTSTLIIGPSAEVRFAAGTGLSVGDDTSHDGGHWGRLLATNVTFTANSTSPGAGFWKGIYFANTSVAGASNTLLDRCVVDWAGGGGRAGAVVANLSGPVLRATAVRHTATAGVWVSDGSAVSIGDGEVEGGSGPGVGILGFSSLSLERTRLRGGTYPVHIQPNVVLTALSGNVAEGYVFERSGIAVEGGVMGNFNSTQSRTWPGGDLPYIVLGDLAVRGTRDSGDDRTSTLIIRPSAEVRFAAGAALSVGDDSPHIGGHWGRLQATAVTFRANVEPAPAGFWKGIAFGRTARGDGHSFFDGSRVESAGGTGSTAAVAVDEISLILRNGTAIHSVGNVGLHLSADSTTSVTVTGGEIEGGSGPAVRALGNSTLSLTGVGLRGGTYPVRIEPNVVLAALSGNTVQGYVFEQSGIAVDGGVMGNSNSTQNRTWPGGDLPYIVLADVAVRGTRDSGDDRTSTLIIGPPAIVRFAAGAGLSVGDDTGHEGGHWGSFQASGAIFTANAANPAPGYWKGIYFANQARDGDTLSFLERCSVQWAGGGSNGAVVVNLTSPGLRAVRILGTATAGVYTLSGAASVAISDSEIEGGSDAAVRALDGTRLSVTGSRLRRGAYPMRIQPNVEIIALGGNAMEGYAFEQAGIAVDGGVMGNSGSPQARTWPGGDLPYIVLADLAVRGTRDSGDDRTSTLIIGSPAQVRFNPGAGLFIGDDSGITGGHWGRLQATGVTFTASSATPVTGFWKGIYFADLALDGAANTYLDACTVDWAGGDAAAVRVNASAPVFKSGLTIRNTATAGIHVSSSSASNLSVLGGEIEGGADAAIRAAGNSTILLRDVTLRGGPYPVRIDSNVNLAGLRGSRAEGYPFERAAVAVESGVMGAAGGPQTRAWPAADIPFLVLGELQVRGNQNTGADRTSTLVIQSGGEVRFERGAGLQIGDDSGIEGGHWGALRASGVTFTANTLSPAPGFWNGLYFADQTRDDLSFLFDGAVEYGGASGGNVSISRSSPYLSGVVIRGSGQDGILASNSSSVLTGSRLIGNPRGLGLFSSGALSLADSDVESNARFGAFNGAPSSLFARFNWWGDPSGPLDPASNPGGLGDRVSERVDYTSWLTASPLPSVAPVSVTAQPGDAVVTLAWSASPERDVTGYNVYHRLPPATAWTLRTSSPVPASPSPSYQDSGLTNRTGHCYHVRAVDSQAREGDPSREACATPRADVTPPAWLGPEGALFAEGGDSQVVVRFEPAADKSLTAAYDIYYSTVSPVNRSLPGVGRIANIIPVPGGAGHALEVTVPRLLNGRRYFFNVQAVDAEGNEDGNAVEATAVIGAGSGAVIAEAPWAGATLDGAEIDGQGRAVLAAGRTEGQITSAVVELPAGADLSAVAWNAVQPAGTAVDTVPGGAPTIEVRAAEDSGSLANARCIAPTGLAAWWPGDGNGREIQGGRDGVLRGRSGFITGRTGSAFQMDGFNDWVEASVDVSETAYSLSLWFRTSCDNCGLFSVDDGSLGSSGHDRHLFLSNGRLCARVWSNETICTAEASYADERWHHAVHVFGGSVGGQKIFIDGSQRASGAKSSSNFTGQTGVNLGYSNDAANGFFHGLLDEVAVFSRALSAVEIQTLFAAGGSGLCKPDADGDGIADPTDACPATPARIPVDAAGCPGGCFGPPANRVSWWRGEGNAADSAATNAGTLAGGTSFDLGEVGQAFRFDGVDDRVEIPNFGSFTQLSVQAWVYREGATNTRESLISYKEGDNPNCGFLLSLNEDGMSQKPRFHVRVNGAWQSAEGTQSFPFGRWTHLAGTYDGQEIRLYVDGVLAAVTLAAGNMTQCNQKTALGSRASFNQHYFPGLLDEVAVFDRALSASEVQALAEAGSTGMCATAPPPSGAPAGTPQVQQGWVQVAPNQPYDLPDGRYVQVRITLRGDGTKSPAVRSVSLGYRGGG